MTAIETRSAKQSYLLLIFFFNVAVTSTLVCPHSVYIRVYPQDVFGFLDGIHRIVSGQVPNRDFSTPIGALVYALPALFVRLGANPLLSLAYAQGALLALNFLILVNLLKTRIPGILGLLFAVWTTMLLAARMNLGQAVQLVTFAENYNRCSTVFLSEILIFLIPSQTSERLRAAYDVICLSGLSLALFYTKMTYFAVAVASLALLSLTSRQNLIVVIKATIIFLVIVGAIELKYRLLGGYFGALMMASHVSGAVRGNFFSISNLILGNVPELAVCAIAPLVVLYVEHKLTLKEVIIFVFVVVASILLINQNAQTSVLAVPFTLLFVTLNILQQRTDIGSQQLTSVGFLYLAIGVMFAWYTYPLALNTVISFTRSISRTQPMGAEPVTSRFLIDWKQEDPRLLRDLIKGDGSPFDIFARARASATNIIGMRLSAAEYAISIDDGVRGVRAYCGIDPGILTMDTVNPFPAILSLAPAGEVLFFTGERMIPAHDYPSAEFIFRNASCLMDPKMPLNYSDRELFFTLYGPFIRRQFVIAGETDYWTIYTRINHKR
jgi:hypothetical protein